MYIGPDEQHGEAGAGICTPEGLLTPPIPTSSHLAIVAGMPSQSQHTSLREILYLTPVWVGGPFGCLRSNVDREPPVVASVDTFLVLVSVVGRGTVVGLRPSTRHITHFFCVPGGTA